MLPTDLLHLATLYRRGHPVEEVILVFLGSKVMLNKRGLGVHELRNHLSERFLPVSEQFRLLGEAHDQ